MMNIAEIPTEANFMALFSGADVPVQLVISILIAASVFSWSVIISRMVQIAREKRTALVANATLEAVESLAQLRGFAEGQSTSAARILGAMADEWNWSDAVAMRDYSRTRNRLASVAEMAISLEQKRLAGRSALLATIGNSAPFIGLFGTVWGIMNSFLAISQTQDTSLAVVAPGMAEALFATAVGLFCAIPASIGYNSIVLSLDGVEQQWRTMAGKLEVAISRHYSSNR